MGRLHLHTMLALVMDLEFRYIRIQVGDKIFRLNPRSSALISGQQSLTPSDGRGSEGGAPPHDRSLDHQGALGIARFTTDELAATGY